jgi:T3SS (YopN, CesT) and YbjN peptide-binding chaperone 1
MAAKIGEVRDQVATILSNMVGSLQLNPGGDLSFEYETARVIVNVSPFGDDSTVINIFAFTNAGLDASPALYEYVARHSGDWVFGALSVVDEEDGNMAVILRQTLLGDFLDPEELGAAVAAIATTADEIDDAIKEQFGGLLGSEM